MRDLTRQHWIQAEPIDWDDDPILSVTMAEKMRGLANRLLYSQTYKISYIVMAILSLICFALTLIQRCPTFGLILLEYLLCLALLFEVFLRWTVQRRHYWSSAANVFDVVMVALCLTLLIFLHGDCSTQSEFESLMDASLLFGRNAIQLGRLALLLKKHRSSAAARLGVVDFTDLEMAAFRSE